MSSANLDLFDEIPGNDSPWDEAWRALCDCGENATPSLEIDSGDVLISCSTCSKSLFHETELVYLEPTPVDVECIQDHNHHWDTIGCDCDFYFELKTQVPKE